MEIRIPIWNIKEFSGYEPITTFWSDFSIADHFGDYAIKDTFKRAFKEWKGDYKYLTEMVLVLNHKTWQWYKINKPRARLYQELYEKANDYAWENLKDDELSYFYSVTD